MFFLLSILAVFSVVISISGSVKYSDATHLPFSGPEIEGETERETDRGTKRDRERERQGHKERQRECRGRAGQRLTVTVGETGTNREKHSNDFGSNTEKRGENTHIHYTYTLHHRSIMHFFFFFLHQ